MAVVQYEFNGDGSTRVFPVVANIISQAYVRIDIGGIELLDEDSYDIINNAIVFVDAPTIGIDNISILIAENYEDITNLGSLTNINIVAGISSDITTVAGISGDVASVAGSTANINTVATEPLKQAILDAEGNATAAENARDTIIGMTATTGAAGTEVVWNSGTGTLTIPRGDKGEQGIQGDDGDSITDVTSSKVGLITTVTVAGDFPSSPYEFDVLDGIDGEGSGNMNTSVYDTNTNGIVDNAEKVNNLTVETAVPAGALFTDTVYDDTAIQAEIDALSGGTGSSAVYTMIVNDTKPSGTDGGDFISGAWRTRDLNTVQNNDISGASLASNQITLPAGTYIVRAEAPAYKVENNQARLYDTTGTATLVLGSTEYASDNVNVKSTVIGIFTLAVESVVELQHRCSESKVGYGFGEAYFNNWDSTIFSQVEIRKIA